MHISAPQVVPVVIAPVRPQLLLSVWVNLAPPRPLTQTEYDHVDTDYDVAAVRILVFALLKLQPMRNSQEIGRVDELANTCRRSVLWQRIAFCKAFDEPPSTMMAPTARLTIRLTNSQLHGFPCGR